MNDAETPLPPGWHSGSLCAGGLCGGHRPAYPATVTGGNNSGVSGQTNTTSLGLMLTAGGTATQTITLSDKTQLGYVNNGASYLLCGNNTGGSGKWYVYDSSVGGSVKASTGTITNLGACT